MKAAHLVLLGLLVPLVASAAPQDGRVLRVCADPNNLPFSNARGEGFENKLAELVAKELHAELAYTWFPQRRGFFRQTLKARRCDVVMGVPTPLPMVLATRPYYRGRFVFVYGPKAPHIRSLDDPKLRTLKMGVPLVGEDGDNPPPIYALAARQLQTNVRGYMVYGNYETQDSPPAELIRAVAKGDVDLAIAWGPLGGYFAQRVSPRLAVAPVPEVEAPRGQTFAFDIGMGVRHGDDALRQELDGVLERRKQDVDALLARFSFP